MTMLKVKAMVTKAITVGLVAGALAMASPAKAQAQHVTFGVQLGGPVYFGHDGYRQGYDREQYEAYCREQAFLRQQAYARQQAYLQHEAWEQHERHEAWERGAWEHGDRRDFHHDDRGEGFRGNDARYDNGRQWDGR